MGKTENLGQKKTAKPMAQTLNKAEIIALLRVRTKVAKVSLPKDIGFSIVQGCLKVIVKKPTQNMQSNNAAFEGWIIALKSWLFDEIAHVELDFLVPENLDERYGTPELGHYNRFLYRINNLIRLFPDWFSLHTSKKSILSDFMHWLESSDTLLNHSLKERESVIDTKNLERQIESWFVFEEGKKLICNIWGIDENMLFNQLPVGIFHEKILLKNAVFTRGASAIDLWGVTNDKKTLHLIELKCGKNISMGVISETLFYTAILYDACISEKPIFGFGRYQNTPETRDSIAIKNNGQKFDRLFVHIMGENYHPLFNYGVEFLIKNGLSNFNIEFDKVRYDYRKKVIL